MENLLKFPVSEDKISFELLLAIRCMKEFNHWKEIIGNGEITRENIKNLFDKSHQLLSTYSEERAYSWYKGNIPLRDNFDMKYTDIDINKFIANDDERKGFHLHQYNFNCIYFTFNEKIEISVGFINDNATDYLLEDLLNETEHELKEEVKSTNAKELYEFIENNYNKEFSTIKAELKNFKKI